MMAIEAGCTMAIVMNAGGRTLNSRRWPSACAGRDPKRGWPPRWSHGPCTVPERVSLMSPL